MAVPGTYRFRLVTYIIVLLVFLAGVLVLSYGASSQLVLREAENNVGRLAEQLAGQIRTESVDLAERARMVRDSARFQEYLFIAVSLGTDATALREQFQRQFGWLQIDRAAVLSGAGRPLVGGEYGDLREALVERNLPQGSKESLIYLNDDFGIEMVATVPMRYRSQHLGVAALTKRLGTSWMETVRKSTGGELLFVRDGKVVSSTLSAGAAPAAFIPVNDRLELDQSSYLVRRVPVNTGAGVDQLWFALSQEQITLRLVEQRNIILGLAVIGAIAILVVGLLLLRNFSAPVGRLVSLMQAVAEGHFPVIPATVRRDEIGYLTERFSEMVASLRDKQAEIDRIHGQLAQQATTDALTGCYNRRYLYDLFPKLWSEALRSNKDLSVLIVDLDHFKQVNDRYGHLAGDEVLRQFSQILMGCCRVSDFVFRLGGEEFLILTSVDVEGAKVLAEKIRVAVAAEPLHTAEQDIPVTVSIGVAQAQVGEGREGLSIVLGRADRALYDAKQRGRNRVLVHHEAQRQRA
jgi:diguanylate cyclase (GGDEF)-like protein